VTPSVRTRQLWRVQGRPHGRGVQERRAGRVHVAPWQDRVRGGGADRRNDAAAAPAARPRACSRGGLLATLGLGPSRPRAGECRPRLVGIRFARDVTRAVSLSPCPPFCPPPPRASDREPRAPGPFCRRRRTCTLPPRRRPWRLRFRARHGRRARGHGGRRVANPLSTTPNPRARFPLSSGLYCPSVAAMKFGCVYRPSSCRCGTHPGADRPHRGRRTRGEWRRISPLPSPGLQPSPPPAGLSQQDPRAVCEPVRPGVGRQMGGL
jgi:hypothetical protein